MENDTGAVYRGFLSTAMESIFSVEWVNLSSEGQSVVLDDLADAAEAEHLTAREYHRRIGAGNLSSYADTLMAGKRRRDRRKVG